MILIVSDANVFVALFRASLLNKVFHKSLIEVEIPTKFFQELTQRPHRIEREYPELAELINQLAYNPNNTHPITLRVIQYGDGFDTPALEAHYKLEKDAAINEGERQAIPLAIQKSATFLSCDSDALEEFNQISNCNGATASCLEDYCLGLLKNKTLDQKEFDLLLAVMKG